MVFEKAKADGRAALVGYLPAGFPDIAGSIEAIKAMVAAGCDIIEVGLPYSDPVMDGPVIQAAVQEALDAGFRLDDLFRVVEAVAATGAPTLVMTSWNPIARRGVDHFAQQLHDAGGAGLITPDVTPDVVPDWIEAADARDLDKVFLVAPSSTDERIAMTTSSCRGFVYATGIMGVTGTTQATAAGVAPLIGRTRAATDLPVGVGVGVSTRAQAADLSAHVDGVIVGTAFVRALREGLPALTALTEDLAGGVRRAVAHSTPPN
ncbi:tryptophan synthase subunit alpha [Nocardioides hungaricus]